MSKKMFDIGKKFGMGFPSDSVFDLEMQGGGDWEILAGTKFYVNGNKEMESEIKKREKKLREFQEKVSSSKDGKYDKKGSILIPIYDTNTKHIYHRAYNIEQPKAWITDYVEIEMTQRELAEAGILPEDFKWMEKARVSAKDIADADREQALTTTEVGGFKGFMKKLLDKFKGKGEK